MRSDRRRHHPPPASLRDRRAGPPRDPVSHPPRRSYQRPPSALTRPQGYAGGRSGSTVAASQLRRKLLKERDQRRLRARVVPLAADLFEQFSDLSLAAVLLIVGASMGKR